MNQTPQWFDQLADNPIVQVLVFVAMFIVRVEMDRWQRRKEHRASKHKKAKADA